MAILRVKDEQGNWREIPAIKGDQGEIGPQGPQGIQGIQGLTGPQGISITNAQVNASNHLTITLSSGTTIDAGYVKGDKGDTGETGATGNGIANIELWDTSSEWRRYRITMTDGTYFVFTVFNGVKGDTGDTGDTGNGISSIELLDKTEGVATYRITMTDGTHFDFEVTDGEVTEERLAEALEEKQDNLYFSIVNGEICTTYEEA